MIDGERERKARSAIEENGIAAALERCRSLPHRISADLSKKKPKRFQVALLAEFQVSLELQLRCSMSSRTRANDATLRRAGLIP
jgi:hypothetical protein